MRKINTSIQRLVIALIIVAVAFVSMACECRVTDIATDWRRADVVFKGKVVSVTDSASHIFKVVMLQVSKVYKGTGTDSVFTILTPAYGQSCGVCFVVGKNYVVFGSQKLYLGICISRDDAATYITD